MRMNSQTIFCYQMNQKKINYQIIMKVIQRKYKIQTFKKEKARKNYLQKISMNKFNKKNKKKNCKSKKNMLKIQLFRHKLLKLDKKKLLEVLIIKS